MRPSDLSLSRTDDPNTRAYLRERAARAERTARDADLATVPDQEHVQRVDIGRRHARLHQLLRRHSVRRLRHQAAKLLLKPTVKMFFSAVTKATLQSRLIDLSAAATDDAIVSLEDPREWSFADLNALWNVSGED